MRVRRLRATWVPLAMCASLVGGAGCGSAASTGYSQWGDDGGGPPVNGSSGASAGFDSGGGSASGNTGTDPGSGSTSGAASGTGASSGALAGSGTAATEHDAASGSSSEARGGDAGPDAGIDAGQDAAGPRADAAEGARGDAAPPATTRLIGYLPDYDGSYATYAKSIDFSKMTHLNLAFVNPPSCGGTCTASSNMSFGLGQSDAEIKTLVDAAHAAGVKVVASIGGGGGDQQIIQFYNAGLSAQLVASLDRYLANHGLDGVDVDIEDPRNMGPPFGTFVDALVAKFRPQGKVISAAVAQYLQGSMPDAALHQFDFVNVMVYSGLGTAMSELQFYVGQKGMAVDRVTLGVPFFGQANGETPYKQILAQHPSAWQMDSIAGIQYVGEATMAAETRLGKRYGGVMIWELTQDAPPPHSLLNVIQNNL